MAGSTVSFRYFVLGLLAQRSMSGYDIKRFLKSLSWLIGSPSFGSLYPALHALLKDELVTVKVAPRTGTHLHGSGCCNLAGPTQCLEPD